MDPNVRSILESARQQHSGPITEIVALLSSAADDRGVFYSTLNSSSNWLSAYATRLW